MKKWSRLQAFPFNMIELFIYLSRFYLVVVVVDIVDCAPLEVLDNRKIDVAPVWMDYYMDFASYNAYMHLTYPHFGNVMWWWWLSSCWQLLLLVFANKSQIPIWMSVENGLSIVQVHMSFCNIDWFAALMVFLLQLFTVPFYYFVRSLHYILFGLLFGLVLFSKSDGFSLHFCRMSHILKSSIRHVAASIRNRFRCTSMFWNTSFSLSRFVFSISLFVRFLIVSALLF